MIASDTSSLSALLKGEAGPDVERLAAAMLSGSLWLPPVVVTELLSDPLASASISEHLAQIELLPILDGYWQRAGNSRQSVKRAGLKCKVAGALVAQSCIDHDVALITRHTDFRHFAKH